MFSNRGHLFVLDSWFKSSRSAEFFDTKIGFVRLLHGVEQLDVPHLGVCVGGRPGVVSFELRKVGSERAFLAGKCVCVSA